MDVQFYLKRANSLTETSIFARVCYNGYQLKYYTPEKILPKYWSKTTKRAIESKKFSEYPEFNTRLNNFESTVKTVFRKYVNDNGESIPTPEKLKALIDAQIKNKHIVAKHNLISFYEELIDKADKGLRINPKTGKPIVSSKLYTTVINHLKKYNETAKRKVDFDTVDLQFYADYSEYLTKTAKLSANTIGKNIQTLKLVLNEATELGLNTNMAYKSKRFITIRENAENIYLDENELKLLEKLDLAKEPKYERVRDLFLVGCYTGLRFSDFSILTTKQIQNGFIEITQTKTGDPVSIPVHRVVNSIIKKYQGELPAAISNQKMNSYLKEIAAKIEAFKETVGISSTKAGIRITKKVMKCDLITTHTARRSFATNQFKAGIPSLTIMAITGHKTEKDFLRYIKVTPKEHANIMKLHWDKNNKKAKQIKLTA